MRIIEREINRRLHSTYGQFLCRRMTEVAYDSVEETLAAAKDGGGSGPYWAGATLEQVKRWAEEGAPQMRDEMLSRVDSIQLPDDFMRPELLKRRRRMRGDSGNELDIQRVYQGRLDIAWEKTVTEHVKTVGNRLVHIVVDLSASAGVDWQDGVWRGACVLRIYDALVRMGKSIAISGYYASQSGFNDSRYPEHAMVSTRIKNYGEPIREDRLAAFSSLPFMRCAIFGVMRNSGIRTAPGLGGPISDYELRTHSAEQDIEGGGATVVVGQAFSRDMAQRTVDKFIETYVRPDAKVEGFTGDEQMASWGGKVGRG